ncbi:MAG TPA: pyrroline-5-carboxylate reductase [Acidobacteriota bacterium]|nr:pyrroline-5-carboxylate reductase [Acidobacteriota bacterium]
MDRQIEKRLAIVGLGKMGSILLEAFLEQDLFDPSRIRASVRHSHRVEERRKKFDIEVSTDNRHTVADAEIVLLCVKPQVVNEVCREISQTLRPDALLISSSASVPTRRIEDVLGDIAVVRAMPNTPCVLGAGMTGICPGRYANPSHLDLTRRLFDSVGRTVTVDEKQMDAVTGLSASGPAFLYIILESLAEAGVKVGLPRDVATLLAAQTALGASQMVLETSSHPALLKDEVTTPAGCTIDGILELEEGKLRVTLIKAVVKAAQRAKQLVDDQ